MTHQFLGKPVRLQVILTYLDMPMNDDLLLPPNAQKTFVNYNVSKKTIKVKGV